MKKTLTNILIGTSLVSSLLFNSSCNYEKPKTEQIQEKSQEGTAVSSFEESSLGEDTLLKTAANFYYKGDYNSAKKIYSDFLEIKKNKNDSLGIAKGFQGLGLIFYSQGDYNKSSEYYITSLKIYENLKDSLRSSNIYVGLGLLYLNQNKFEKALEHLRKDSLIKSEILLREPENLSLKNNLSNTLNNLGMIFDEQKEYEKALKYYFNSLKLSKEANNKSQEAICYNNIAIVYREENHIEKAYEYYQKSLTINKELEDKAGATSNFINISDLYLEKSNYFSALENLKKADTLAKEINSLDLFKDIYLNFSEVYELKGDLDSALKYYKKFSETKDSLLNSESLKQVAELETKYQTEKKELENTALKKDNQIVEEKNKKQQWGLFGLAAFLGLGGVFSYSMYKSRKKIKKSKKIIEEKNKEITDSINYAKNIQNAILPNELETKKLLGEHFIFYKPKDIVSGDFYWTAEKSDKAYFAACDCTGHGIPGAFMSVLNSRLLNNAIEEKQIEKPNEILNYVRTEIINSLKSKGKSGEQKDGMDAILCAWDKKTNTLEFACANNPLYLIRNNELIEHKSDKMPVGYSDDLKDFSLKKIALQKNDLIYISSDGYVDQFGGPNNKKFMKKKLKELLLSINQKPMSEQKEILNKTINDWMAYINPENKKPYEQIDDLCMIGLRI